MTHFFSAHLAHSSSEYESIIKNFDRQGTLVGDGRRNIVKYFNVNGVNVNFKSFKEPNLINKIVYRHFRKSKARRSYENASYLVSRGFHTPEPIAYLEYYDLLGLDSSFYICRQQEQVVQLREVIDREDYPDREKILQTYTGMFFRMHELGIEFLDNSPGNSLVEKAGDHYNIYLVDLNRMRFNRHLEVADRMQNFSRITKDEKVMGIIAFEYARLLNTSAKPLKELLLSASHAFWKKLHRKKSLKRKWKAFKKAISFSFLWAGMHQQAMLDFI